MCIRDSVHTAHITPQRRAGPSTRDTPHLLPLRFHSHDGQWYDVEGEEGESLMQVARRYDLPGIEATCGGELECATCHAYVCDAQRDDPQARGMTHEAPSWSADEVSQEEDDMLEYAPFRQASSRLTCQVRVTRALSDWMMQDGGRVELNRY